MVGSQKGIVCSFLRSRPWRYFCDGTCGKTAESRPWRFFCDGTGGKPSESRPWRYFCDGTGGKPSESRPWRYYCDGTCGKPSESRPWRRLRSCRSGLSVHLLFCFRGRECGVPINSLIILVLCNAIYLKKYISLQRRINCKARYKCAYQVFLKCEND